MAGSKRQASFPGSVCNVTWDDVFFSADLPRCYDPDAALTTKPAADEHAVALVDFDGPATYRLEGGAKLTGEGGGRFGRGLRLKRALASSAVIPLSLQRMLDEGTLEFWFAPDEVPEHIHGYSALMAGNVNFKLQHDSPTPGMTTAGVGRENRLIRDPDNDGAYWKLADVKPGRYYASVWYESGKAWSPRKKGTVPICAKHP